MKKFEFKGMAIIAIMAATALFVSCTEKTEVLGGLDTITNKGTNNSDKNAVSVAIPVVYFAESMLADYDVTATINGQQIVMTVGNTQSAKKYNGIATRSYQGAPQKVSNYPTQLTVNIRAKLKDGRTRQDFIRNKTDFLLFSSFKTIDESMDSPLGLRNYRYILNMDDLASKFFEDKVPDMLKDKTHTCNAFLKSSEDQSLKYESK